jgi:hypothetical protein
MTRTLSRLLIAATAFVLAPSLLLASCGKGGPAGTSGAGPAPSSVLPPADEIDAGPARKAEKAAGVNERVKIPAGPMVAGSTPGDDGRDPLLEPTLLPAELGPFEIDKLPYPNDPSKPPRTGVSRDEARTLCQERGARLCSELEWERACKGPGNDLYAAGNGWDPACARDPASCTSGFGVLALGGAIREWTESDLQASAQEERRRTVVRGAPAAADGVDHRCAHRSAIDATAKGPDLGFRCCKGAPNAAAIPPAKVGEPSFSKSSIDLKKVSKLLAATPRLAAYAKDIAFFPEEESIKTVLSRGDGGTSKGGPVFTTGAVQWSPVPTEEVIVLALKSKGASLILALYQLPEDRLRLASSMVLKDENGPVILSFTGFNKKRVLWSTCWECSGEQGAIEHRDGKRIVVLHY